MPRLFALSMLSVLLSFGCRSEEPRPHLFLITSDSLRADHLSLNGYVRETSPHLAAFARGALNFTQAVTLVPKTGPSFASLFTGMHPLQHRVKGNPFALPDDAALLAEILQGNGYATTAFVSNVVLAGRKGYARGFDRYEEFRSPDVSEKINASFGDWAGRVDWSVPQFSWIHYLDPHGPYEPGAACRDLFVDDPLFRSENRVLPLDYEMNESTSKNRVLGAVPRYQQQGREDRVAWYVSQYDAEIRCMDTAVGEVLEILEDRSILRGAGVVFSSDHGESLGEHDYYFEHGWFAYDASLRIPLIVKPPQRSVGAIRDDQASSLDIAPTLLGMAGLPAPPHFAGRNLLLSKRGSAQLVQNTETYPDRFLGIRTPAYKLIVRPDGEPIELYSLVDDPRETHNLMRSDPARVDALRRELTGLLRKFGQKSSTSLPAIEPSDEERDHLERLGYIDPRAAHRE